MGKINLTFFGRWIRMEGKKQIRREMLFGQDVMRQEGGWGGRIIRKEVARRSTAC